MATNFLHEEAKKQYLEWLLTPPAERDPLTKAAFGEDWNVAQSTLWRWEGSAEFQDELRKLKFKWGVRFHGDILARLMDVVMNGTDTAAIQASKVLLAHLNIEPEVATEDDITEDHLKAIREALESEGYSVVKPK